MLKTTESSIVLALIAIEIDNNEVMSDVKDLKYNVVIKNFLIVEAKSAFIKLREAFTKASIL